MSRTKEVQFTEEQSHKIVIDHLIVNHPGVLFNTDASGIRLPMGLALKFKKLRSHNGYPDIAIYEPVPGYCGCFIELKKLGVKLYKKDGCRVKNIHYDEQHDMHDMLRSRGYYAEFAVGHEDAITQIENYLKRKKNDTSIF